MNEMHHLSFARSGGGAEADYALNRWLVRNGIWVRRMLNRLAVRPVLPFRAPCAALNALACRIALDVRLSPGVLVNGPRLAIGSGSFVAAGMLFDADAEITLGRHVHGGSYARLITQSHRIGPPEQHAGETTASAIELGDGAWIGAQATVLGGVTVGPGAVVPAGAVVISNCEGNTMYAGVPATAKRHLEVA
jgi:maltose O-acetyltransferase